MASAIFKLFGRLPLAVLHQLGALLGLFMFAFMHKSRQIAKQNIVQSQLMPNNSKAVLNNFIHLGKSILETPHIWESDLANIKELTHNFHGMSAVNTAMKSKQGVIMLTPHMGCFEITSQYFSLFHPITVMFRPPKMKWLSPLMANGRSNSNISLAEANASGVRLLMKSLKQGGAVGILPDQVPKSGEGEWANFFDKPAYTMTLASKLAKKTGAHVFMVFAERLENGKGFTIHLTKVDSIDTASLLNQAVENQIKQCPSQYNWHYHRYKARKKAKTKQ